MRRAFTLVEIMIVVAIIAGLVMLSTPNILRSRIIANEGVALANLKTISKACQLYHINRERYPADLSELAEDNPPYIDSILASGNKQGYDFIYSLTSDGFTINVNPSGILKGRYFYTDQTDVVRANSDGPAGPGDEIVR